MVWYHGFFLGGFKRFVIFLLEIRGRGSNLTSNMFKFVATTNYILYILVVVFCSKVCVFVSHLLRAMEKMNEG